MTPALSSTTWKQNQYGCLVKHRTVTVDLLYLLSEVICSQPSLRLTCFYMSHIKYSVYSVGYPPIKDLKSKYDQQYIYMHLHIISGIISVLYIFVVSINPQVLSYSKYTSENLFLQVNSFLSGWREELVFYGCWQIVFHGKGTSWPKLLRAELESPQNCRLIRLEFSDFLCYLDSTEMLE